MLRNLENVESWGGFCQTPKWQHCTSMGLGDRTPMSSMVYSFFVFMSRTVSPRRITPSFTRKYTTTPCSEISSDAWAPLKC